MFAESTPLCLYERSIYLYIMNISSSVGTHTLSLPRPILYLYYTISIYKSGTLFSAHSLPSHISYPFRMFLLLYIYSIYRGVHSPATFPTLPIVLLYSLYIE